MKKGVAIAGIIAIGCLSLLEFFAGINEGAFSRILRGVFLFAIGVSYLGEIRKQS